jgi:Flp pilus assembly protein TadG
VESLKDRPGAIVKLVILVVLAIVIVICAIDAISILRARSDLTNATKTAATAAAAAYKADHDETKACAAATASIKTDAPDAIPGKHFCKIDTTAGTVRIALHEQASTILIGKIPYVRRVTVVNAKTSSADAST